MSSAIGSTRGDDSASRTSRAARRIMRDMAEMHSSPIQVASAAFADDANIYEVHANLVAPDGPYRGLPFHVIITFPPDYPTSPPSLRLSMTIPHPNVFSTTFVCLDLLRADSSREPYVGWSSAYTLQSVLLQLESFLFDDRVPQDGYSRSNVHDAADPRVRASVDAMRAYCCSKCGHRGAARPFPPLPRAIASASSTAVPASASLGALASQVSGCMLAVLPDDLLKCVLDMLAYEDLKAAFHASTWLRTRMQLFRSLERRELICFHSKMPFHERAVVLGVGISPEYHRDGVDLKALVACPDLLSYDAYATQKVRCGVWKDPFTHFLPLWLNAAHGKRGQLLLEHVCTQLTGAAQFRSHLPSVLLCKLMNSSVVEFMKETETMPHMSHYEWLAQQPAMQGTQTHASERALQSYISFHQLLLACEERYRPALRSSVVAAVDAFARADRARAKQATPDLGEWLIQLGLAQSTGAVPHSWRTLYTPFLQELFARNVMWLLREHPELGDVLSQAHETSPDARCYRLRRAFASARTGLRLVAFQVYFLRRVMTRAPAADTLAAYDASLGRVTERQVRELQAHARLVQRMQHIGHFFELVGVSGLSPNTVVGILCAAVQASEKRGYHRPAVAAAAAARNDRVKRVCMCGHGGCCFAGNRFSPLLPPRATPQPAPQPLPQSLPFSLPLPPTHSVQNAQSVQATETPATEALPASQAAVLAAAATTTKSAAARLAPPAPTSTPTAVARPHTASSRDVIASSANLVSYAPRARPQTTASRFSPSVADAKCTTLSNAAVVAASAVAVSAVLPARRTASTSANALPVNVVASSANRQAYADSDMLRARRAVEALAQPQARAATTQAAPRLRSTNARRNSAAVGESHAAAAVAATPVMPVAPMSTPTPMVVRNVIAAATVPVRYAESPALRARREAEAAAAAIVVAQAAQVAESARRNDRDAQLQRRWRK